MDLRIRKWEGERSGNQEVRRVKSENQKMEEGRIREPGSEDVGIREPGNRRGEGQGTRKRGG